MKVFGLGSRRVCSTAATWEFPKIRGYLILGLMNSATKEAKGSRTSQELPRSCSALVGLVVSENWGVPYMGSL